MIRIERTITTYNGTSGWSGSDTSRDRVLRNDRDGTTLTRQQMAYQMVVEGGYEGATALEICEHYNLPKNSIAPALTNLHHAGEIDRVKASRREHEIYVLPKHVSGRPTTPPGRRKS